MLRSTKPPKPEKSTFSRRESMSVNVSSDEQRSTPLS